MLWAIGTGQPQRQVHLSLAPGVIFMFLVLLRSLPSQNTKAITKFSVICFLIDSVGLNRYVDAGDTQLRFPLSGT
jgi:hypothetical protein